MRFDLVDLRLFLRVAEARSITHGAERSSLALASASGRIRAMEEALGVALLRRGRRGVELTAAGQCLVDHARLVLQQVEVMHDALGGFASGLKGRVRLLSNTAALSEHLPALLAPFLAAHPETDIELEERESADVVEAVAAGRADIGIASDAARSEAVLRYPFREDRLVLVHPPRQGPGEGEAVFFRDLLDRDFVGLARDSALQRHLAGHAAREGRVLRLRVSVSSFDAVCRMVAAGVGVAIVPLAAAERCRSMMELAWVLLAERWATRRLDLCAPRRHRLAPPARRLLDHLRRAARSGG